MGRRKAELTREKRQKIRWLAAELDTIQRAAVVVGENLSEFARKATLARAARVLKK